MMNSMWAGDKIIQKKDINISIAVATEDAYMFQLLKMRMKKRLKALHVK